jgi:stringent starvation protein B
LNIENIKKKRILEQFLLEDHVMIHLDSNRDDVIVPLSCKNNPILTLKVSKLFFGGIDIKEEGVKTSLKFSGQYFDCFIPWDSIWGMTSEKGEQKIWENYFPHQSSSSAQDNVEFKEDENELENDNSKKNISASSHLKRIK